MPYVQEGDWITYKRRNKKKEDATIELAMAKNVVADMAKRGKEYQPSAGKKMLQLTWKNMNEMNLSDFCEVAFT